MSCSPGKDRSAANKQVDCHAIGDSVDEHRRDARATSRRGMGILPMSVGIQPRKGS